MYHFKLVAVTLINSLYRYWWLYGVSLEMNDCRYEIEAIDCIGFENSWVLQ